MESELTYSIGPIKHSNGTRIVMIIQYVQNQNVPERASSYVKIRMVRDKEVVQRCDHQSNMHRSYKPMVTYLCAQMP